MTAQKSYIIKEPKAGIEEYRDFSIVQKLLALRNIEKDLHEEFLAPDFEKHLHDPFLLKDMDKVVDRMLSAIENKEKILVYSDFDADGLPGAAVIHDFFTTIGYQNVDFIAPDRHEKGFGFHPSVVKPYLDQGVTLVITIDCGIADVIPSKEIIDYGVTIGAKVDIIITDHHLPAETLPHVFAIINPKQAGCDYPEKMLCGAAVIFKVVCALVARVRSTNHELAPKFPAGYEKWLLDLVGIATLSDMVPLLGENRALAHFGLVVLRRTRRPGLLLLYKTNMIDKTKMLEEDVTFTISPRINVASRLASPQLAFRLLTTRDFVEAEELSKELNNINARRKTMVANTMKQAHHLIKDQQSHLLDVLVVGNPDWKPPILGLVATQLIRTHKRPTFVWGRGDDGLIKGSVRGVEGADITELMNGVRPGLFVNKGGHAQAGGFSITTEHVIDLGSELNNAYSKLYPSSNTLAVIEERHVVDLELDIKDINLNLYKEIMRLAPFGVANEKPLLAIKGIDGLFVRKFGKQKEHLEVECGPLKAIQFFSEYDDEAITRLEKTFNPTIIGHLELNQFRGASELRIKLIDII